MGNIKNCRMCVFWDRTDNYCDFYRIYIDDLDNCNVDEDREVQKKIGLRALNTTRRAIE